MDNMGNAIYLGDIDPNNSIISVMNVRRIIMFQLLIWDKIILSDSQLITDPRLSILMNGYSTPYQVTRKYGLDDVPTEFKGIEVLFENGAIDVASRMKDGEIATLHSTWKGMKRGDKPVPFLPEDERYIDHLSSIKYNAHSYEISDMSEMFRSKLLQGLETDPHSGGITLGNSDFDVELRRLFNEKTPLFRNILDFMLQQRNSDKISSQRYERLYRYVYGCYHVNVSEALGCNINTRFENLPFHIDSGEEYHGKNASPKQLSELRATWALNPVFLDYLTFDDVIAIKKKVTRLVLKRVREVMLGRITSDWVDITEAWASYTGCLEEVIKAQLHIRLNDLRHELDRLSGADKLSAKPRLEIFASSGIEIAKTVVSSAIPIVGTVTDIIDMGKCAYGAVVALSKTDQKALLKDEIARIDKLLSPETRVVTNYGSNA